jgi:hypothetical protein
MTKRTLLVAFVCALCAGVAAEERKWEKGTWRETKIERPKVIDTGKHSLELRQDATVETPQIDAVIGDTVLIAVEKKTVYVKDSTGKEHKLSLRKQTPHER